MGNMSCGKDYPCVPASTCFWRWSSCSVWPSTWPGSCWTPAPRVQAEDQSVMRLAREFVETIVAGLNETPDPDARLNQIVRDLSRLRHVSITRQGDGEDAPAADPLTRR